MEQQGIISLAHLFSLAPSDWWDMDLPTSDIREIKAHIRSIKQQPQDYPAYAALIKPESETTPMPVTNVVLKKRSKSDKEEPEKQEAETASNQTEVEATQEIQVKSASRLETDEKNHDEDGEASPTAEDDVSKVKTEQEKYDKSIKLAEKTSGFASTNQAGMEQDSNMNVEEEKDLVAIDTGFESMPDEAQECSAITHVTARPPTRANMRRSVKMKMYTLAGRIP